MARSQASVRPFRFAALLIGVVIGTSSGAARAQEELDAPPEQSLAAEPEGPKLSKQEADKKARALFEQGKHAYEDGNYRDAWDYFRQAYLLSKRPELLYNVGQSADRLRMDREALEAFRLYLRRLPDAENRKEVENRVRALEQRLSQEQAGQTVAQPDTLDEDPAYAGTDQPNSASAVEPDNLGGGAPDGEGDEGASDAEAKPAPTDGQPLREGWYVSVALGLGAMHDGVSASGFDASISSITLSGQLALGHQVLEPALVLGGALMFDWGLAPKASQGDFSSDMRSANLTMLGPFAEYYLDPRGNGWHLFGALALAWLALSDQSATVGTEDASGGALLVGGGHEWKFGSDWTVGVLGRLTLARLSQDIGNHTLGALSVLASVTWF
jgi:hypothetical protein